MPHNRDLEELFTTQYAFNRKIAPEFQGTVEERTTYVRNMTLAAHVELTEALNEWGWKPWSTRRGVDIVKYRDELADVGIFLINLAMAADISAEELYDAIASKQAVNVERQRVGYAG